MSREGQKFSLPLPKADGLFSTEEMRQEAKKEKVETIELERLIPFENHPFKVIHDEELEKLIASIKENGVIYPAIVRPKGNGFELVSGHRRKVACEILGLEAMPVFVRDMTDSQAVIAMVDSNVQRENVLPSEKAFAYKMKLEAIKRQAGRPKNNSRQVVGNYESADLIGRDSDESGRQIQRYIRLTELIPELLKMVDDKQIAFNPAVELSYLQKDEQKYLLEAMECEQCTPSLSQSQRLKKMSQENALTADKVFDVLTEAKPNQKEQIKFQKDSLKKYFPSSYSASQMEDVILKLLGDWQRSRQKDKGSR